MIADTGGNVLVAVIAIALAVFGSWLIWFSDGESS